MKFSLKDLKPTAEKWGRKLGNAVRKSAPRHLHSMIHTTTKVTDTEVEIRLYTDAPTMDGDSDPRYPGGKLGGDIMAREFGTKRKMYTIKPRKKKYLAFSWETANQENLKAGLRRRQRESWAENVTFTGRGKNKRAKVDGVGFNNSMKNKGKVAGYDGNRWMFFRVTHPGYSAWNTGKGFITPAYLKIADDIGKDEEMSKKMTKIIADSIERSFNAATRQGGVR